MDRLGISGDIETTLLRIATGARLLGAGWVLVLGMVALIQERDVARPEFVLAPVGAVVVWGGVAFLAFRRTPDAAISRVAIVIDVGLGAVLLLAPSLASISSVLFYGGMPLIAVGIAAVRSRSAAWAAAAALIVVTLFRESVTSLSDLVTAISQIIMYSAAAFIFSWAFSVLRSSDTRRRLAAEAAARAEERAEISRHIHDSVLQTLALIQRSADRSSEVVSLARRQERELREWLYGTPRPAESGFADAVRSAAAEVEEQYEISVDVVAVGDTSMSPTVLELVRAGREAIVNSARHSEAPSVSVYAEVAGSRAGLYVRDRGKGFDPGSVPVDRRGISGSIAGRLERVRGKAVLRSSPGSGTEWRLEVPL